MIQARRSVQLVDAFRIALGKAEMPRSWLEAIAADPDEAAQWRAHELLRSLSDG